MSLNVKALPEKFVAFKAQQAKEHKWALKEEQISEFFSHELGEIKTRKNEEIKNASESSKEESLKSLKMIISDILLEEYNRQTGFKPKDEKKALKLIIERVQNSINHGGCSPLHEVRNSHFSEKSTRVFLAFLENKEAIKHLENICAHRNTIVENRKFSLFGTNYTNTASKLIGFIENFRPALCPNTGILKKHGFKNLVAHNIFAYNHRPLEKMGENISSIESALTLDVGEPASGPYLDNSIGRTLYKSFGRSKNSYVSKYAFSIPPASAEKIWKNVIQFIKSDFQGKYTAVFDLENNRLNIYNTQYKGSHQRDEIETILNFVNLNIQEDGEKAFDPHSDLLKKVPADDLQTNAYRRLNSGLLPLFFEWVRVF